jgi:uncharacterized protein YpiB (UPF0302 family)
MNHPHAFDRAFSKSQIFVFLLARLPSQNITCGEALYIQIEFQGKMPKQRIQVHKRNSFAVKNVFSDMTLRKP